MLELLYPRAVIDWVCVPQWSVHQKRFWMVSQLSFFALGFCLPLSSSMCDIFSLMAILAALVGGRANTLIAFLKENRVAQVCAVFVIWLFISFIYTVEPFLVAWSQSLVYKKVLYCIFFMSILSTNRAREHALNAFLLSVVFTLTICCMKFFKIIDYHPVWGAASVFKSHIETNFIMALGAYFVACKACRREGWKAIVLWSLFVWITTYVFFMSGGRSGYLVYFALSFLFLCQRLNHKKLVIYTLLLMLIGGGSLLFSTIFKTRMQEVRKEWTMYQQGQVHTSLGLRLFFAKTSLELIKAHPILGTGAGSFPKVYQALVSDPSLQTRNPHNEYLHVTVQFGLVGLAILLAMYGLIWRESFKLNAMAAEIVQAVALSMMIGSFFNSWLMDITEGFIFAYFIALGFSSMPLTSSIEKKFHLQT